jgi:hypothetical protein
VVRLTNGLTSPARPVAASSRSTARLASELARDGIRVVSLLTGGVIDSIPDDFEGRNA